MAYEKTVWIDQEVENPRTYSFRQNLDGTITLLDAFGNVTEPGTPVNAENMNKIEQGIADAQLPNQSGNSGKFLTTDGTTASWGEFKQSNHQVVSVLPVEPEEDVFYYIPE